jgi:hypothetical protein
MIEILDFISEHKKAVAAVLIALLCLILSGAIAKGFTNSRDAAARDLQNVNNNISQVQDQLNQPITKYRELDHGYHLARVNRDRTILEGKGTGENNTNEWLSRFLTWSSGQEYTENRNWFVEKLGSSNVFVTDIMRPYDETHLSIDDHDTISDADAVGCTLNNTEIYVNSINENNDTYNYVIFAYFNAKTAFSNNEFDAIDKVQCYIITVSVDKDGNVLPDTFVVSAGPPSTIF